MQALAQTSNNNEQQCDSFQALLKFIVLKLGHTHLHTMLYVCEQLSHETKKL